MISTYNPMFNSMMSLNTFRDFGHLQEVNRDYFHPRGMALTLVTEDDGSQHLQIADWRHDPEGIVFEEPIINSKAATDKAARVEADAQDRRAARVKALGFWQQPLGSSRPRADSMKRRSETGEGESKP